MTKKEGKGISRKEELWRQEKSEIRSGRGNGIEPDEGN